MINSNLSHKLQLLADVKKLAPAYLSRTGLSLVWNTDIIDINNMLLNLAYVEQFFNELER